MVSPSCLYVSGQGDLGRWKLTICGNPRGCFWNTVIDFGDIGACGCAGYREKALGRWKAIPVKPGLGFDIKVRHTSELTADHNEIAIHKLIRGSHLPKDLPSIPSPGMTLSILMSAIPMRRWVAFQSWG
jgi:hypothetical protein